MKNHLALRVVPVLVALTSGVTLLLTGCSSSSGGGIGAGHQTPQSAVEGVLQAILAGDYSVACTYFEPDLQSRCTNASSPSPPPPIHGNFVIRRAFISGNKALVAITGHECGGGGCTSNSNSATGMPANSAGFAQAYSQALQHGGFSPVPCVRIGGQWYVATP